MITQQKLQAIIDALVKMRDQISDDMALEASALYPSWKEGQEYITGQRLLFNDVLYKVLQNHTSQSNWTPDIAPSLFAKVLTSDTGEILPWVQPDSTNAYKCGDKVSHNGANWISDVDNNVWEPGVYGWTVMEE